MEKLNIFVIRWQESHTSIDDPHTCKWSVGYPYYFALLVL